MTFRAELESLAPGERDAWVDRVLGIDGVPEDGPELPRGCVPYLPCPVEALLRAVDHAGVQSTDVIVDIGSGIGRAAIVMHLVTGAPAIGVEVQPELVAASRELAVRCNVSAFSVVEGDAAEGVPEGTVYFLYCPFSGERLERVLDGLERTARSFRVCCVGVHLPPRPWLREIASEGDVVVYLRTLGGGGGGGGGGAADKIVSS